MVRLTGFEPVAIRLEGGCSIQLSYRRIIENRSVKTNILKHTAQRQLPKQHSTIWSECKDSNLGPPGPKPGALPDCATLRIKQFCLNIKRLSTSSTTCVLMGCILWSSSSLVNCESDDLTPLAL
jgi:hypothetical protein